MVKVSRRGGFSDRQGIKSENTEIQMKNFDNRTRIQIFNLLSEQYHFFYGGQYIVMILYKVFLDMLLVKCLVKGLIREKV